MEKEMGCSALVKAAISPVEAPCRLVAELQTVEDFTAFEHH